MTGYLIALPVKLSSKAHNYKQEITYLVYRELRKVNFGIKDFLPGPKVAWTVLSSYFLSLPPAVPPIQQAASQ